MPTPKEQRSAQRRKDDQHILDMAADIQLLQDRHGELKARIEEIKTDTSAIVQEFKERKARMKALGWYADSTERILKNVVRPLLIMGFIVWALIYTIVAGHLPTWARGVAEALK